MNAVQNGSEIDLSLFNNSWYDPERFLVVRSLWFFGGLPILRSKWIPSSALRVFLLRAFGASVGGGVVVKPGVRIKHPWMLTIGENAWIGENCWIDNLAPVTIADNACLSQDCYICTGNHDWSDAAFGLIVKPVEIGAGAWVGARALIAPGVILETGAVAAAGSVVTKRIPAWEIHAGNPASFIRRRIIGTAEKHQVSPEILDPKPPAQSVGITHKAR